MYYVARPRSRRYRDHLVTHNLPLSVLIPDWDHPAYKNQDYVATIYMNRLIMS